MITLRIKLRKIDTVRFQFNLQGTCSHCSSYTWCDYTMHHVIKLGAVYSKHEALWWFVKRWRGKEHMWGTLRVCWL